MHTPMTLATDHDEQVGVTAGPISHTLETATPPHYVVAGLHRLPSHPQVVARLRVARLRMSTHHVSGQHH